MTYNDIIKKLESIGIAIDYTKINVDSVFSACEDARAFEDLIVIDHQALKHNN